MALTISVIVCAHNEAAYLPGCLHSLLAQTRPADEILVINNASADALGPSQGSRRALDVWEAAKRDELSR